ncbi:hypothetical protein PMIN02_003251 [Paraphaeosphaeria minitans]|uniref:RING-type domain-containing protein n=1 Tax=Paraphaeosphaeria minitans TaxID=565426 RepID=A0A9P6KMJ9_9PLEO|nr:hypothetical protein PMIN01_09481 [Paraphaeosphaeria minitans]
MADRFQYNDLRNIVQLLRKPYLTKVDPVPSDERCCICLHDFDSPPTLANNEPPCKPMQLHPCGHLVGDTCHTKLPTHHQAHCLLCTRPLTYTTPVPKILTILCKMDHLGHVSPVGLLSDAPLLVFSWPYFRADDFPTLHGHIIRNALSDMQVPLFSRGSYSKRAALRLWLTHLKFLLAYLTSVVCALAASHGIRTWARYVFQHIVSALVTPGSLPFSERHDYVLGCVVGGATGIAATVLVYWKNSRVVAPQLERVVGPCMLVCMMAFESWLTAKAKAEVGFKAAVYCLLTPFVVYAGLYALLAGWLIYLGWRHRVPRLV